MSTHNSIETDAWIAGLKAEISRLNDALTLTSEGNRRLQEQLFNAEQQIYRVEKERDEQLQEAITIWNKAIDAAASKAHGVGDDGVYYQIKDLKK